MIAEMDHKVLLPAASKIVKIENKDGSIEVTSCDKRYVFPEEDVLMLDIQTTTAEEMARMMAEKIIGDIDFPKTVKSVAVGLDEERGQTAWYTKVL
jgi:6-pyruvoyltetrahydropterin/6-carboxytetrahydropterin synthase